MIPLSIIVSPANPANWVFYKHIFIDFMFIQRKIPTKMISIEMGYP